jgi:hypothetical protein
MKFIHYTAISLQLLLAFLLIWFNIQLFWPVKTLEINNYASPGLVETTTTTFERGKPIVYRLAYCKYTTVPAIVTRTMIDGQIITLSNTNGYLPTGCHNTLVETSIIPDSIPIGEYYLDIVLRYPINPFRTEVVHYRTNLFQVVK